MEKDKKPDLSGHVNGLDINIFKLSSGVEISVEQEGVEVVLFRYSPQGARQETETATFSASPLPAPSLTLSPAPEQVTQPQTEVKTPVKMVGTIEEIEGMGTTPQTGDAIFRFSLRWHNPRLNTDETVQIASFREIAQSLNQFYTSPDPAVKLQPGREISLLAWDHTLRTGSYYPSSVNYLNFPTITYPKTQKRR